MKQPNMICWDWPFLSYKNDSSPCIMFRNRGPLPARYNGHHIKSQFSPIQVSLRPCLSGVPVFSFMKYVSERLNRVPLYVNFDIKRFRSVCPYRKSVYFRIEKLQHVGKIEHFIVCFREWCCLCADGGLPFLDIYLLFYFMFLPRIFSRYRCCLYPLFSWLFLKHVFGSNIVTIFVITWVIFNLNNHQKIHAPSLNSRLYRSHWPRITGFAFWTGYFSYFYCKH